MSGFSVYSDLSCTVLCHNGVFPMLMVVQQPYPSWLSLKVLVRTWFESRWGSNFSGSAGGVSGHFSL